MKITILKPVDIEVKSVRVTIPVYYEEEDIPNDFPLRNGNEWQGTIDLATGKIKEWPEGTGDRRIFMKVCDGGTYSLLGPDGNAVATLSNYVPECIPEGGDYIDFKISSDGVINNWNPRADFATISPNQDD
jgi:hypothetical protein